MDLMQHLPVIWRRRWRIAGASLLVAAIVLGVSASRPKTYRAEAVLRVPAGLATTDRAAEQTLFLARTYASLTTTRPVLSDALARSALPIDLNEARRRVEASADNDVGFIDLVVTGPSPAAAETLGRGLTAALLAAVERQGSQDRAVALKPLRDQAAAVEQELAALTPGNPKANALEVRYAALLQALSGQEVRPTDFPALVAPARAAGS
ncbi:MAG: hypothetical protein ABIW46_06540, partial [Acidimicrobiales bacterium]